jgi:hypothetical protein
MLAFATLFFQGCADSRQSHAEDDMTSNGATTSRHALLRLLATTFLCACSGEGATLGYVDLDASRDPSDASADSGSEDDRENGEPGADDKRLKAHIEGPGELRVSVVTLTCDGDCVEVTAVAEGGNPPYAFAWRDGTKQASRTLCPAEDATFKVDVTDTASLDSEFPYQGQRSSAEVDAHVLTCDDGPFCLPNPSLEGEPNVATAPRDWSICRETPDVHPAPDYQYSTQPSDGDTFVHLISTTVGGLFPSSYLEVIGTQLCGPLPTDAPLHFQVDLTVVETGLEPAPRPMSLQIWGANTPCGQSELLWFSSPLETPDAWQTFCATITPSKPYTHLILVPQGAGSIGIDNFRPRSSCD